MHIPWIWRRRVWLPAIRLRLEENPPEQGHSFHGRDDCRIGEGEVRIILQSDRKEKTRRRKNPFDWKPYASLDFFFKIQALKGEFGQYLIEDVDMGGFRLSLLISFHSNIPITHVRCMRVKLFCGKKTNVSWDFRSYNIRFDHCKRKLYPYLKLQEINVSH